MSEFIKRWVLELLFRGQQLYWRWRAPLIVGVRGIIVHRGRLLLIRHNYGQRHLWYLPGGAVKRKETLVEALCREVREELHVDIQVERLHGIYYNFSHGASDHVIVFTASLDDATGIRPGWEIAAFDFFPLDALPDTMSPATRRRIEEYLTDARHLEYRPW